MKKQPKPEWSFPVDVLSIGSNAARYTITAKGDECEKLAERYNVVSLENVWSEMHLVREQGGLVIHVTGTVQADVTQTCVVTLEPMVSHVSDSFDAFFADPEQAVSFARARANIKAKKGEIEVEMIDEHDAPDEIINGQIDLGEVAAQFLSLAIDPYPRSVTVAEIIPEAESPDANPASDSPFAALKAWKDGLK